MTESDHSALPLDLCLKSNWNDVEEIKMQKLITKKKKFQIGFYVSLCLEQTLDPRNNNPLKCHFRLEVLRQH